MVLNVENRDTLADRFGRETDGWIGKKVTLITRSVQGPNGPCQGIRFADPPVGELIGDELPDHMRHRRRNAASSKGEAGLHLTVRPGLNPSWTTLSRTHWLSPRWAMPYSPCLRHRQAPRAHASAPAARPIAPAQANIRTPSLPRTA